MLVTFCGGQRRPQVGEFAVLAQHVADRFVDQFLQARGAIFRQLFKRPQILVVECDQLARHESPSVLGARMPVVQERRKLFAQRLIAFGVMARDHRILEQSLLHILRQFAPGFDHRLTERQRVA